MTPPSGVTVTTGFQATTNWAAPESITTGALSSTLAWEPFLGLKSTTGPNGDMSSTVYDQYARPASTTAATGAVTTYAYASAPPWTVTATTNGRWVKTTLDGLGRTIKVERGTGGTTVSIVETEYAACACSPLGKVKRVSMPYAPGAAPHWTEYSYDALGRTLKVTAPGGSYKEYEYAGETVKVYDEARKWKKYWMDGLGNLVRVEEPKPAADSTQTGNYITEYSYDVLNHLTRVSMTRGGVQQLRTFDYGTPVGAYLRGSMNPESGTVAYTYNTDGTLASKVDAKGLKTVYGYDALKRVTGVYRYPSVSAPEDEAARVELSYDTNPYVPGYSGYTAGRLTARKYVVNGVTFKEMYGYTAPGQVAKKKLRVEKYGAYADLESQWEYNQDGQIKKVTYPGGGVYQYGFDAMGRLKDMKDPNDPWQGWIISDATYGPAGELKTMTGVVNETRSYNERLQLTGLNGVTFSYDQMVGGQLKNNGQLMKEISSGETVVYQYDELNRLVKAETEAAGGWGQQFGYDGFGNLTSKSGTPGHAAAPTMNVTVNGLTNRVAGYSYDANGNQLTTATQDLSYDYENRAVWVDNRNNTGRMYGYDPDNRRVYGVSWSWNWQTEQMSYSGAEVHFWGVTGQRMATFDLGLNAGNPGSVTLVAKSARAYFGGRLVVGETGAVQEDRLGSVGKFYPYGEARVGDPKRFATYERDEGGLDYAVNRYYWVGMGRFMSADPYMASGGVADPGSWNRYAYVGGDPIGFVDPKGLDRCLPGTFDFCVDVDGGLPSTGPGGREAAGTGVAVPDYGDGEAAGQGGGGRAVPVITIKNAHISGANQARITAALDWLEANIDEDCRRWVERGAKTSFAEFLADIRDHIGWGEISSSNGRLINGVTSAAHAQGDGSAALLELSIVLNQNGAFFNPGVQSGGYNGRQAQINILLHEFGHANEISGFESDLGDDNAGTRNNARVRENCGSTLAKLL